MNLKRDAVAFVHILALATVVVGSPADLFADQPVYLSRTWFHRGPDVNVLTSPAGTQLVVDNDGRHLVDDSINGDNDKSSRLDLNSIQSCDGEFYMAIPGGYGGNSLYQWFSVTEDGRFLDPKAMVQAIQVQRKAKRPLTTTFGFYYDFDPARGDAGMLMFPKAGLTITCSLATSDSRQRGLSEINLTDETQPLGTKDNMDLPLMSTDKLGSVHSGDLPDQMYADPDGLGFWYVGHQEGKLAVLHSRPSMTADGARSLNCTKPIVVGDARNEDCESGVASSKALYLLVAHANNAIGGVDEDRRLVRVDLASGSVSETKVSFKRYIADARLAMCGEQMVAHARQELIVLDGQSLKPLWSKSARELSDNSPKDYGIYRVCAGSDGKQLAVALATAYRHEDEPTLVVTFSAQGELRQRWQLKPGSVDDFTFTADGGVMLFSSDYTAKLGGSSPVLANEIASIALADHNAGVTTADEKRPPEQAGPFAFVTTPLQDRHKIWFDEPGGEFLPLGNGTLGAMMFGGTDPMRIVLNLDSMWTGSANNQGTFQSLGELHLALGQDAKNVTDCRRELDLRTGVYTMTYRYDGVTYKREAFCSYPRGLLAIRLTADKPGAISGDLQLQATEHATFTKDSGGISFSGIKRNNQKFECFVRV